MGFQAQIVGSLGRFQPEQPAANDGSALRPLAVGADLFKIFNSAIDKDTPLVNTRHRWDKGIGTSRQHYGVVGHVNPFIGTDVARLALNLAGSIADMRVMPCSSYHSRFASMSFSALRCAKNDVRPTRS